MEATLPSAREVFTEAARAVLGTWPVLQIAVDNGFGGAYSQQKADWMVDAVQQYFQQNDDLQQWEIEDFLAELMNNEFNTVVDDGSLPQVASQLCQLFTQCHQGKLSDVKSHVTQLLQKNSGRVKATPAQTGADGEEEEESEDDGDRKAEEQPMECEEAQAVQPCSAAAEQQSPGPPPPGDADDGWTVVRRKK